MKYATEEARLRANELQRIRRKESAGRTKEQKKRYYLKHREKNLAYAAEYHAANKEVRKVRHKHKNLECGAKWCAANPERERTRCQAWKNANKENRAITNKAWRENNRHRLRAYSHNRRSLKKSVGGELSSDLAERLMFLQKGRCACCGKSLADGYQMDHIIPVSKGGQNIDSNIQLLTPTCNRSKGAKDPIKFMQMDRGMLL